MTSLTVSIGILFTTIAVTQAFFFESELPTPSSNLPWWKTTIIYQVDSRFFKDSDGDGIGDLQGLISKLQHFKYLGVETLLLAPFCKSPQKNFGYDISDYKDVDPVLGSMADFRQLLEEAKMLGLRIMMDFVPNYTSDQHDWFQKSLLRNGKYADFYIWSDGYLLPHGTRVPPNNWVSESGESAWTWREERKQYYLHQSIPEQPILNVGNSDVKEEIELVIRYWLDQDIDGLGLDTVGFSHEALNLLTNNLLPSASASSDQDDYLTANPLLETQDQIVRWQKLIDDIDQLDGKERFMLLETYTDSDTRAKMSQYGAHPINFDLVDSITLPTSAKQIMGLIAQEYNNKPNSYGPIFVIGNHDSHRMASRYGHQYVNAFNMLLLTLKGTPVTYYGEEIGMEDNLLNDGYLAVSRNFSRSPMQWTSSSQAGFTTASSSWLPVQENYTIFNVESEKQDPKSHINLYRQYASLRQLDAFRYGDIDVNIVTNDNVLSYLRTFGEERYLVAINMGQNDSTDNYSISPVNVFSGVVIANTGDVDSKLALNKGVALKNLVLHPGEGIVVKL